MRIKFSILIISIICILGFGCYRINTENTIGILPLGGIEASIIDTIESAIQNYYGFKTCKLAAIEIPKAYYVTIKSPRYRADSIIMFLKENKPDSIDYIIGFTSFDISTTKRDKKGKIKKPESKYLDWGIFGLGYRPGPSSVVSDFRLKAKSKELEIERIKKVTLHELGHNLGLPHCINLDCFMRDAAESINTIDAVKLNLCDKCKNILGLITDKEQD